MNFQAENLSENGESLSCKMEVPDEISEKSENIEENDTEVENSIKLHSLPDSQGVESKFLMQISFL